MAQSGKDKESCSLPAQRLWLCCRADRTTRRESRKPCFFMPLLQAAELPFVQKSLGGAQRVIHLWFNRSLFLFPSEAPFKLEMRRNRKWLGDRREKENRRCHDWSEDQTLYGLRDSHSKNWRMQQNDMPLRILLLCKVLPNPPFLSESKADRDH